jgi:putative transposase
MQSYRKTSHSLYDLKVHFVWTVKYRKPILWGGVAERTRELIREVCRSLDVEIISGHVARDHVHLFVSLPPHVSASRFMQAVKGKSAHHLLSEFKPLGKAFWGRHLWARGYFAASSGNVTDEVIKQYIEQQGGEPQDADMTIEE